MSDQHDAKAREMREFAALSNKLQNALLRTVTDINTGLPILELGINYEEFDELLAAALREADKRAEELQRELLRKHFDQPDFKTFVDLKYGIVGDILFCLQEGEISRGKAAEALAEIAHGATTVDLPKYEGYFEESETPVERCKAVEQERDQLRKRAEDLQQQVESLEGGLVMANKAAKRRGEDRDQFRDLAKQLAETLEFIQTRVADTGRASELVELIRLNSFPGAALAAYRAATEGKAVKS